MDNEGSTKSRQSGGRLSRKSFRGRKSTFIVGSDNGSTKLRKESVESKKEPEIVIQSPENQQADEKKGESAPPRRKSVEFQSSDEKKGEPGSPPKKEEGKGTPGVEAEGDKSKQKSQAEVAPPEPGAPTNQAFKDGKQTAKDSPRQSLKGRPKGLSSTEEESNYETDHSDSMAQEDKSLTSEGYETEFYIESETEEEEFFEGESLGKEYDEEEEEEEEETSRALSPPRRSQFVKEMWSKISEDIKKTFDEPTRVFKLRGYHSEPDLSLPFEQKFEVKLPRSAGQAGGDATFHRRSSRKVVREKFLSCEDLVCGFGTEHPSLVRESFSELKLLALGIDEKMQSNWKAVCDLERKRFSFFDELFAMGYVVDSLEVLAHPPKSEEALAQSEYFVEAEEKHFRKKVDYGRVVFKTKHVYTGNFEDWYFQGPGRYSWQDGTVYLGEFAHGVMHGAGSVHWPDGSIYEGHFINGLRTGWGVYSSTEGNTYAGNWEDGLPHGHGKMWYDPDDDENDYYEGHWEQGVPQGIGTRQYATGDRYVGNWEQGKRNGYGIMMWLQERQVYKGEWLNGVPHGSGKHIWYLERTRSSNFPTRHVYEGDWVTGRREGIGRMVYPCGSIYDGRWKNGQRHGKGMFLNPAGEVLVGLFRAGSLLGGSDVPLHAPTYDCDFGDLKEWTNIKFGLTPTDRSASDEERLHALTKQYLPYLRKLYHRAGEYSQRYGNHGLYPAYMKRNEKQRTTITKPPVKDHTQLPQHKRNIPTDKHLFQNGQHDHRLEKLDDSFHMKGKLEKPESLDNVNPVTRFGLWLFIRDCDGLVDEVTMAYYDQLWGETPTISFQTRHNPFEPVYLWQFLQALIVTATAYYVDIPRLQAKKAEEGSPVQTEESVVSEVNTHVGDDHKRALMNRHRRARSAKSRATETRLHVSSAPSKKVRKDHQHHPHKKGHHLKHSHSGTKLQPSESTLTPTTGANETKLRSSPVSETPESKKAGAPEKDKRSSLHGEVKGQKKRQKSMSQEGPAGDAPNKPPNSPTTPFVTETSTEAEASDFGASDATATEDEFSLHEQVEAHVEPPVEIETVEGTQDETGSQKSADHRKSDPSMSVSECFETFLIEKLLPCLKREPGSNLPDVPQPLPGLADMFDSFKSIREKDILKGIEFVRSALPHLVFPNPKDALSWRRINEPLSLNISDEEEEGEEEEEENLEMSNEEILEVSNEDNLEMSNEENLEMSNEEQMSTEEIPQTSNDKFPMEDQVYHEPEDDIHRRKDGESEYLGARAQSSETALRLLKLCKENPHEEECKGNEAGNKTDIVTGNPKADLKDLLHLTEFATEGNPFDEMELVPRPFLLADDYKCVPVQRDSQHFENITTHDVFEVINQLYPKIDAGPKERHLQFNLVFCDWVWCTSLLAKTSVEREFEQKGWRLKPDTRLTTNPQSLGVYAHHIKQIKNNPYLAPTPNLPKSNKTPPAGKK